MKNHPKNSRPEQKYSWKSKLYQIIFGTDTFWGKTFDIVLLLVIALSIITVMLESVNEIAQNYLRLLKILEWMFTILFLIEYILRIIASNKPFRYIFSFLGIIDFLSILPTFLGIFLSGSHALMVLRSIRLIRIFRIFKLARYLNEATVIARAMRYSAPKITVFLVAVMSITIILGTLMYLFEGSENGFTNIPKSIYWAIVTLTTVGYGDITPQTFMGQIISSIIMIMGYGIIAVPTGIVSGEFVHFTRKESDFSGKICKNCLKKGHDPDAKFCKNCGAQIKSE
jgi:voltage-gated potassium channel